MLHLLLRANRPKYGKYIMHRKDINFQRHTRYFSVILILLTLLTAGNTFAAYPYQLRFIKQTLPQIKIANHETMLKRNQLLQLYHMWSLGEPLGTMQKSWLKNLAATYRVDNFNISKAESWETLTRRVDNLPNSLVLAQASIESDWGRSYFAKHANNLFGRWCTVKGCGIVPRRRQQGARHEIKAFDSTLDSIRDYILNINVHPSYKKLRILRQQSRVNHQGLDGSMLAKGLKPYSELGDRYITIVQARIKQANLDRYDL